jgi:osmotically-inducible protein OsmY
MGFLPRGEIMRCFSFNLLKNSRTTDSLATAEPTGRVLGSAARLAARALLTGFLIAFLPATSTAFAANTPARPAASAQPNDSQISTVIRTKLAKSKIGADGFKFRVEKGVVTWEGHTEVPQHKGAATRMARAAGAAQVINNIEVGAAGKAKASAQLHPATVASQ